MRDLDEQWIADLAERSRDLVPDVPVDVASALRGGRRRRTQRRAVGGGALVAVMIGAGLGIPALPRPTTVPGVVETATGVPMDDLRYAEVVDASVMCADGDWLYGGQSTGEAPRSGPVPPDFEPVAVVECWRPTAIDPYPSYPQNVRLEGDLGPLLSFLADPPEIPPATGCTTVGYVRQDLYLVSRDGRAVRAVWPTAPCGEPLPEVRVLLDELEEVAIWEPEVPADEVAVAEIADAVPACHDLGQAPSGLPRTGTLPPDFEPVVVAYCVDRGVAGWEQQMLEGDLRPLLAFLAQPSPVGPSMGSCTYEFRFAPQIYLVDRAGRAVAPQWPYDSCHHPAREGEALVDALDKVSAFDEVTKLDW